MNHHIFINLHTTRIYCLPENYEVLNISLNDIKFNLRPVYSAEQIRQFDTQMDYSRALTGAEYLPGYVGLNNLKAVDYFNVVI